MAFPILVIVILIILIVWWALLRNARKYRPDFPVHTHEEQHASAHGADTYAAERAAAHAIDVEPQPVVQPAPRVDVPPSAADTTAQRAAAVTEQPLVSDTSMYAQAPSEPATTPPPSQPYATDYGSPVEGSAVDAGTAGIFETRAPMAAAAGPDDLAILEGIGPRVKEVLAGAGITTFAQLAATDVNTLRQILEGANLRFLDPGTWPEQARMAAEGRMDDLQTFTDSLRGGRRTAAG